MLKKELYVGIFAYGNGEMKLHITDKPTSVQPEVGRVFQATSIVVDLKDQDLINIKFRNKEVKDGSTSTTN